MPAYSSAIIPSPNDDFPFIAVVTDEAGTIVSEIPVRTEADGAAVIENALKELHEHDQEGRGS
ncbi:MAG: hypothetical protein ABWZ86_03060 [Hyphomicrobium sp.]